MTKIVQASEILELLGLPKPQRNERSALTLLALAGIGPRSPWKAARARPLRTVDVMAFMRDAYGKDYKPNSRETIRRQTLHQFEQARVVDRNADDPTRPTNSGKNAYQISAAALRVVRAYGTSAFDTEVAGFLRDHASLAATYAGIRETHLVPLRLSDGSTVSLSPGKHNELQVAVVNEFGPRFAPGAELLYFGDTARKRVVFEAELLRALGVPITEHDKLPDLILYWRKQRWLYLVEAVTSHGPVSPKRHSELERMLGSCRIAGFRRYAAEIAWDTEVWVAENPDHMIHFNGQKFLGPYALDGAKRGRASKRSRDPDR